MTDPGAVSADPMTRRVAVIGDVGGHLDELREELRRLGVEDGSDRLPPDLTVIQVGDLIHRGPDSDGVIALVDRYLSSGPGQWIQLIGNHEAQYLRQPLFEWPERVGEESIATLRRWWDTGRMRVAASVVTETEGFLVTHAGLTCDFWRRTLAAPHSPEQAAAALNSLAGTADDVLFRAGSMLQGRRADRSAGPIWAATGTELIPSWLGVVMPFSQVHGHTSMSDWSGGGLRASAAIARLTTVDPEAKHETTRLRGGRLIGIDPGHSREPRRPWRSWVVQI
jgi:hypothetical protein